MRRGDWAAAWGVSLRALSHHRITIVKDDKIVRIPIKDIDPASLNAKETIMLDKFCHFAGVNKSDLKDEGLKWFGERFALCRYYYDNGVYGIDDEGYMFSNIIANDAVIDSRARVTNTVVMANCEIGYCNITDSVIQYGSKIGISCWVKRSTIGKENIFAGSNVLADCVTDRGVRLPWDVSPLRGSHLTRSPFTILSGTSLYQVKEVSELGYLRIGCQHHHILVWDRYVNQIGLKFGVEADRLHLYRMIASTYHGYWLDQFKIILKRATSQKGEVNIKRTKLGLYELVDDLIVRMTKRDMYTPAFDSVEATFHAIQTVIDVFPILLKCSEDHEFVPEYVPRLGNEMLPECTTQPFPQIHGYVSGWDLSVYRDMDEMPFK
jgi:hypothetical protein